MDLRLIASVALLLVTCGLLMYLGSIERKMRRVAERLASGDPRRA